LDLETACHFAGVAVGVVYALLEQGKVEAERRLNTGVVDDPKMPRCGLSDALKKARATQSCET